MIKRILPILIAILFCASQGWATDYYVRPHNATAGCQYGSCNGTDYANAWEGFAGGNGTPINWATVDSGNGKLFVCGDHREKMTIPSTADGEDGTPLHIADCLRANGASTDDPGIINGADLITSWTSDTCNGVACYYASMSTAMYQLFDDGEYVILAHEPDSGSFYEPEGDKGTIFQIGETGDDMTYSEAQITGATVVVHPNEWSSDAYEITSYSSSTIYLYDDGSSDTENYRCRQGGSYFWCEYYLANKFLFLDASNEYFWDDPTDKVYVRLSDASDPGSSTMEGSTRDYGIYADEVDFLQITGITIKQQYRAGIRLDDCLDFLIEDTAINKIGTWIAHNDHNWTSRGIWITGADDRTGETGEINGVTINGTQMTAIYVFDNNNVTVDGATITNNAVAGKDAMANPNHSSAAITFLINSDYPIVKNCNISNSGGTALNASSSAPYPIFDNNTITDSGVDTVWKDDFGAIYVSNNWQPTITNNTITNVGATTNEPDSGIYLDEGTAQATVTGNLISGTGYCIHINQPGGYYYTITGNVCLDYSHRGFSVNCGANACSYQPSGDFDYTLSNNHFDASPHTPDYHVYLYSSNSWDSDPCPALIPDDDWFDTLPGANQNNTYYPDGATLFYERWATYPDTTNTFDDILENWQSETNLETGSQIDPTENFCVSNGDTWNSSSCASDCSAEKTAGTCMDASDFNTSGNWATVGVEDKIDAGDTIYFASDGGEFRAQFNILGTGLPGVPITLKNYPGDTPVIRLSNSVTSWTHLSDQVYYASLPNWPTMQYARGADNEAGNGRALYYHSSEVPACYVGNTSGCSSWANGYYYGTRNDGYVYYKTEAGSGAPSSLEVAARHRGILGNSDSYDYIVIDGLTFKGSSATSSEVTIPESIKAAIHNEGGDNWTVQNCTFQYNNGRAFSIRSSSHNNTFTNNLVEHYHTGVYTDSSNSVVVTNNRFLYIGATPQDDGDRDAVGIRGDQTGSTITDNYIYWQGWAGQGAYSWNNIDGVITLYAGYTDHGGTYNIKRNIIRKAARGCIMTGEPCATGDNPTCDVDTHTVYVEWNECYEWGWAPSYYGSAYQAPCGGIITGFGGSSIVWDKHLYVRNNTIADMIDGGSNNAWNAAIIFRNSGTAEDHAWEAAEVTNNLLYNNDDGDQADYDLIYDLCRSADVKYVHNNLFYRDSGDAVYYCGAVTYPYECVNNDGGETECGVSGYLNTNYSWAVSNIDLDDGLPGFISGQEYRINNSGSAYNAGLDWGNGQAGLLPSSTKESPPYTTGDPDTYGWAIGAWLYDSGYGSTYSVCASGCDYSTIAAVNAVNFNDASILEFECGESFYDATLTLASVTNASTKTITIQDSCGGVGTLPIIGGDASGNNGRQAIKIEVANLSVIIKNIDISGQKFDYGDSGNSGPKLYLKDLKNITIDGVEGDGSLGTPASDYDYYKTVISIKDPTGTVEVKNCTLQKWGHPNNWDSPATYDTRNNSSCTGLNTPYSCCEAGTGNGHCDIDYNLISVVGGTSTSITIHDNTLHSCEGDAIMSEGTAPTLGQVYGNTAYNCGENSLDFKGTQNYNIYKNWFYRNNYTGLGGSSSGGDPLDAGLISIITVGWSTLDSMNNHIYENKIGHGSADSDMPAVKFGPGLLDGCPAFPTCCYATQPELHGNSFHHNEIIRAANGIYLMTGGEACLNADMMYDNEIYANEIYGAPSNGRFLRTYKIGKSGSPNKVRNNSFYSANSIYENKAVSIGSLVDYLELKNNAVHINDADAYFVYEQSCTAGCTFDSNQWHNQADATGSWFVNSNPWNLSQWNALSNGVTVGTDAEGDPLFNSSTDLRLQSGSPCRDNADGTYSLLSPTSVFPDSVTTGMNDEIGAYYYDAPPGEAGAVYIEEGGISTGGITLGTGAAGEGQITIE